MINRILRKLGYEKVSTTSEPKIEGGGSKTSQTPNDTKAPSPPRQ